MGGKSWDFVEAFRCPCPGQALWGGKGVRAILLGDNSPLAAGSKLQSVTVTVGLPAGVESAQL